MKGVISSIILLLAIAVCSAEDYLSFTVVGDWGGQDSKPYTTKGETHVANYMGIIAGKINASFTVALGDNFYDNGVSDVYDKRFNETYEVNTFRTQ